MSNRISFRPISDDDIDFLKRVYSSTREHEMSIVPWTEQEKIDFLEMQFNAQHTYYQQNFGDAKYDLILEDDEAIGRLYVDRREDEIRIIDIALLSEHRGRGIGGKIMKDLLNEAAEVGKAVTIHVEHYNPAMHLYERLGFKMIEDQEVYYLMKWESPE